MSKLEEKVRAQFQNWIEEDELEAIIDSELQKARNEVAQKVRRALQDKITLRVEEWLKKWEASKDADKVAEEIGKEIIARLRAHYFEDSTDAKLYYRDSWNSPEKKVYEAVDNQLGTKIENAVHNWGYGPEAQEISNKVVEKLIPQAAAAALERLAISFLQGRMHPQPAQDNHNQRY